MLGTSDAIELERMHMSDLRLGDGVPEALVTLAMANATCPAGGWKLITLDEWSCIASSAQTRLCNELHASAAGSRLPVAFRAEASQLGRLTLPAWLPQENN